MKPFFPYYGSKYRLCKQGFYPAPKENDIIVEPFAGSACYSVCHCPEQAILFDSYWCIAGIWDYLIHASPSDIMNLPSVITHIEELDCLPTGASNLIKFWLHKAPFSPATVIPAWYKKHRNPDTCHIWSQAVKKRIAGQVDQIKGWSSYCLPYSGSDNFYYDFLRNGTDSFWFIDPPYSGKAGRKYKEHDIDYDVLSDWVRNKGQARMIVCENEDLVHHWLDFKYQKCSYGMRGKRTELMYLQGFE